MKRTKYEYHVEALSPYRKHVSTLTTLGAEGWELVDVLYDVTGNQNMFYFKRPVAEKGAKPNAD